MSEKKEYLPKEYYRYGMPVMALFDKWGNPPEYFTGNVCSISNEGISITTGAGSSIPYEVSKLKPILRRMENMTEEEREKYEGLCVNASEFVGGRFQTIETGEARDYLREIGVDLPNNLIDSGQAVDAKIL